MYSTSKYTTLLNNLHIYQITLLSLYSVFLTKIQNITQQSTHLPHHTTFCVYFIPHQNENTPHYSTIYTFNTTLYSIYRVCHTKMHQITQHLHIYQITLLSMYSVCHTKIHHITQQFTHLPHHSTLCIVYATPKYSTLLNNLHIYHITLLSV